jgi:NAD(P)-dependent dehydrogenase (short-subunit alcohol dehydrogenase family)
MARERTNRHFVARASRCEFSWRQTMKTFLSIGSGPGVSFATAERFAKHGFQIVFSSRNAAKTRALAEQLRAKGYRADGRTVDCGDPSSVASLVEEVERSFGGIEVLHYNAAAMRKATIREQPRETFNQDLAINIGGALAAVQAVIASMSQRGSGSILLTGGGYALKPNPDYLSLSIGKAGIRGLALGLFESLAGSGIHIATVTVSSAVTPGSREVEAVAEHFWALHGEPKGKWTAEVKYLVNGH